MTSTDRALSALIDELATNPTAAMKAAVRFAACAVALVDEIGDPDWHFEAGMESGTEKHPDDELAALAEALYYLGYVATESVFEFGLPERTRCAGCGGQTRPNTQQGSQDWHVYMVQDEVWAAAGMTTGHLCIPCLEARVGRALTGADFPPLGINMPDRGDDFPRLAQLKAEAFASWPACCRESTGYCLVHNSAVATERRARAEAGLPTAVLDAAQLDEARRTQLALADAP